MTRSLCVLASWLLTYAALAVPAPDPFVSGWGNPIDPDRDCKIIRGNGTLTIEMPGTDHDYDPTRDRVNAPRLVRELEDDFEMQVRIHIEDCDLLRGTVAKRSPSTDNNTLPASHPSSHDRSDFRPSAQPSVRDRPSFVSGGFLIIPPDSFATIFINLQYGIAGQGTAASGFATQVHRDVKGGGTIWGVYDKRWRDWPFKEKPEHVYLRLERHNETLLYKISSDQKKWAKIGVATFGGLPPRLKVGLATCTTSTEPSKVCFDQFRIMRGKKK